jgi:hypothetical protein
MKALKILFVLVALGALAGCSTGGSEPTYTVHGTVTLEYQDATGDVSIVVTHGSDTYSVAVPAPAVGGIQTLTYSVSGVPTGTYTVTLSYATARAIDYAYYVLNNDGVQLSPASFSNDGLTTTMATEAITVSDDLQLDVTTGRGM